MGLQRPIIRNPNHSPITSIYIHPRRRDGGTPSSRLRPPSRPRGARSEPRLCNCYSIDSHPLFFFSCVPVCEVSVGSFSVTRVQADGRSESDAVLIRLQFPCLPSGWHPRESSKIISFHLLVICFLRFSYFFCVSFSKECAVMKMLYYFYVWTSEINL